MTDKSPRPRAFRLDDHRVAVDDGPSPLAPMATIMTQRDPTPVERDAPLDVVEREVETANSPIAPSIALIQSSSLRTSRWTKRHVPRVWSIAAATLSLPAPFTSAITILAPSSAISSAAGRCQMPRRRPAQPYP